MKKLFFVCSLISILLFSSLYAYAIDGDGTEETPFLITNQGELELVTDFPKCHFKLANDIELEGTWTPLCKETVSGYFSGVFDGAGYTISNLYTDGTEGGLFKHNSGTIKNLNVVISEEGLTGNGAIASCNNGTISNCIAEGNISGNYDNTGGICALNYKYIDQCKFIGNVESSYSGAYVGGICGDNDDGSSSTYSMITRSAAIGNVASKGYSGGICGYNRDKIENCYFIGGLNGSSYEGGIAGYNPAYITNCYAVPTFTKTTSAYGIGCNRTSYGKIQNSYYNKTISGLSGTSYGIPKSTVAMKMKQTYATNWDFDTIWEMDKNINDGYPYLLWEYPTAEEKAPYSVNYIKVKDLSGNTLEEIPVESFYIELNVTKNDNLKNADNVIIACYDENNALIDMQLMSGIYYQNQTISFSTLINNTNAKIGTIKGFVWDSISGMIPLSNVMELNN